MINMCQFIFAIAGFAFIGVIYILVLEFTGIFKINNDDEINEELLDELLIKDKKNVSNNKKNKKEDK